MNAVHQHELTERLLRLRTVPVFRTLAARELARVAESVHTRTFERGEVLLREEEPPRSIFLVGTGTVTMRRRGKRIGVVRAPGAVGFMAALARTAGSTEAVAETYVESFELGIDVIDDVFEDHFTVLLGTIRSVCERMMLENRSQEPPPFVPPTVPFEHLIGDRELGIVERIFLLRSGAAFRAANVNSIARLARAMTEMRVPAGEVLWEPGDVADASYFIVKGMMRLVSEAAPPPLLPPSLAPERPIELPVSEEGGLRIQSVGPGYFVGGAESLVGVPRWNRFVADEPGIVLRGSRENFIDMFEDDHEIAIRFLSMMASTLMAAWDRKAEAGIVSIGSPDSAPTGLDEEDDEDVLSAPPLPP